MAAVTFTTPQGTRVTCEKELAETMGYKPPAPAKKAVAKKASDKS